MKICTHCGKNRKLSSFSKKTKTQKHYWCKFCFREYAKRHYRDNIDKYKKKARKWNKIHLEYLIQKVYELKDKPCCDCHVKYNPWQMDFDHRDGSEKIENVSMMIRMLFPIKKILEEIEKCDLVCSNCHRQRTYLRRSQLGEKVDTLVLETSA